MKSVETKLSVKEKIGYSLGDTASHFVWDIHGNGNQIINI